MHLIVNTFCLVFRRIMAKNKIKKKTIPYIFKNKEIVSYSSNIEYRYGILRNNICIIIIQVLNTLLLNNVNSIQYIL